MIYSPTVLLCVGGDLLCPGVLLVAVHGHLHTVHVGVLALDHVGQQAAGEGQELAELGCQAQHKSNIVALLCFDIVHNNEVRAAW